MVTLDFIGAVLGIIYILLEYRASIWLWIVSIIMPLVDMMLYFRAGLYADFGMAVYYALAAIYGFWMWKRKSNNGDSTTISSQQDSHQNRITFFPRRLILPTTLCFLVIWMAIYQLLIHFTDSSVPITDSFTSALSIVALWALAHKYAEQWLLWIVVDAISSQQDSHQNRITFFPRRLVLPTIVVLLALWIAIYEVLIHFTDSSVPVTDSFTSALSIVALWALAHKYAEQWLLWIVVDAISSTLYVYKGIPFKASLYGLYVVIAIFGYRRWRQMAKENDNEFSQMQF